MLQNQEVMLPTLWFGRDVPNLLKSPRCILQVFCSDIVILLSSSLYVVYAQQFCCCCLLVLVGFGVFFCANILIHSGRVIFAACSVLSQMWRCFLLTWILLIAA